MVYVFLANGFEIVEALAPVDVLKRAGVAVCTVSITDDLVVESSNKTKVYADTTIDKIDFEKGEMLVLPGGLPGADNLAACDKLVEELVKYNKAGKKVAAICAAPDVLGINGILEGKKATCYPGFEDRLVGADYTGTKVEISDNVITSCGMGASIEFGLALANSLVGEKVSSDVAEKIRF